MLQILIGSLLMLHINIVGVVTCSDSLAISCPAISCPAILMVRHFQRPLRYLNLSKILISQY